MATLLSSHTHIFFIGFSGSGKTTIGRKIAKRLGFSFYDLDGAIEHESGIKISDIFREKGEEYFRKLESSCLQKVIKNKFTVVSCGGGTPVYNNNMQIMNESGVTVYLKMNPKALCYRLERSKNKRPLLASYEGNELVQQVEAILKKREPFYNQAKIKIDADKLDITELMRLIRNFQ